MNTVIDAPRTKPTKIQKHGKWTMSACDDGTRFSYHKQPESTSVIPCHYLDLSVVVRGKCLIVTDHTTCKQYKLFAQ